MNIILLCFHCCEKISLESRVDELEKASSKNLAISICSILIAVFIPLIVSEINERKQRRRIIKDIIADISAVGESIRHNVFHIEEARLSLAYHLKSMALQNNEINKEGVRQLSDGIRDFTFKFEMNTTDFQRCVTKVEQYFYKRPECFYNIVKEIKDLETQNFDFSEMNENDFNKINLKDEQEKIKVRLNTVSYAALFTRLVLCLSKSIKS